MKVYATEYLKIDLDTENWECRSCDHVIGSARETYKKGLKLYKRNPQDIHRPILDPDRYGAAPQSVRNERSLPPSQRLLPNSDPANK